METPTNEAKKNTKALAIAFGFMVVIGLGNKIFQKLETIPMRNYPTFLNFLTTFMYVPVCFMYIIPASIKGIIPKEQLALSKRPFLVMGLCDALAGILQTFSATYLPGPLLILLSQAAIPVSMIISRVLLKEKFTKWQYLGATVVAAGIAVVLAPTISGSGSVLWAILMIVSCIPMALGSVYKEIALGATAIDPMYLNGWVAIFQLFFCIVLIVPTAYTSDPPVSAHDLPQNMWNGVLCFIGRNSLQCVGNSTDCKPDECEMAPIYVSAYLAFNQGYNLLILLILKFGGASILYLALTIMVPLGNVAFTLPFVPEHKALRVTDLVGLVIICVGLVGYRFMDGVIAKWYPPETVDVDPQPLLEGGEEEGVPTEDSEEGQTNDKLSVQVGST